MWPDGSHNLNLGTTETSFHRLCNRCGVEPRHLNMTICRICNNARMRVNNPLNWLKTGEKHNKKRKEQYWEKKRQAKIRFFREVMGGICAMCADTIAEPLTRKGRIRYVCPSCFHQLFKEYKMDKDNREKNPYIRIREAVRAVKRSRGIFPSNAWETLGGMTREEKRGITTLLH